MKAFAGYGDFADECIESCILSTNLVICFNELTDECVESCSLSVNLMTL